MGTSRIARGIADPVIEFYRPLPLRWRYCCQLIVIWLGIDEGAKITLIYLACFAPLAMAAKAGVRAVPIEQINAAYSLGGNRWQIVAWVILPAALPEILTGMRIAIGFGWTTLVAAEMVAATEGLGQMVLNASNFLRTDIVVMGIIIIGILAYLFDLLMRRIEAKLTPWKGTHAEERARKNRQIQLSEPDAAGPIQDTRLRRIARSRDASGDRR